MLNVYEKSLLTLCQRTWRILVCAVAIRDLYPSITPFTKVSGICVSKGSSAWTLDTHSNPQHAVSALTLTSDSVVGVWAASLALDHYQRKQRIMGEGAVAGEAGSSLGSFPWGSVPLSPLLSAHCVLQLLPSITLSFISTISCLFLTTGFFLPLLSKTWLKKGYYKIIFSVHWSATSVQDEIIHFDEFEKLQLLLIFDLWRLVVWTQKGLKLTRVRFYLTGTFSSRYLKIELMAMFLKKEREINPWE